MTLDRCKHVTIIGVGLLGGSIGLAIKRRNPAITVAGVGRRQQSLEAALEVGAIDEAHLEPAIPAATSDIIILATPVGAFESHLRSIAGSIKPGALVTDVGSTKSQVVRLAQRILGPRSAFVGSHPMAGSEKTGPLAARADLLEGAVCVVTPTAATPKALAARTASLWRELGMRVVQMSPQAHDKAVARISHLPHMLASLLMLLPNDEDLKLAAGGFADMTRIAGGDSVMWRDIAMTNGREIIAAIDRMSKSLEKLRKMISMGEAEKIEQLLAKARQRRSQL